MWGPLKCAGPCSAKHVRIFLNPPLISALGHKISTKCNDLRESTYIFQRLVITLQRFNSVLLRESFVCDLDK